MKTNGEQTIVEYPTKSLDSTESSLNKVDTQT